MFVMALCVVSLATTMYVMYLNGLADDDPVTAMSAWVIILALGVSSSSAASSTFLMWPK